MDIVIDLFGGIKSMYDLLFGKNPRSRLDGVHHVSDQQPRRDGTPPGKAGFFVYPSEKE
jgi:hypothetical protein